MQHFAFKVQKDQNFTISPRVTAFAKFILVCVIVFKPSLTRLLSKTTTSSPTLEKCVGKAVVIQLLV